MTFLSLDEKEGAELAYAEMAAKVREPGNLYDRAWARATLDRALLDLKEEYRDEGRAGLFRDLEPVLSGDGRSGGAVSYPEIAARFSMSEEATRMAASRMRRRLGELLRRQVRKTVAESEHLQEELRYLFSCL
jgi:hypothetical protein